MRSAKPVNAVQLSIKYGGYFKGTFAATVLLDCRSPDLYTKRSFERSCISGFCEHMNLSAPPRTRYASGVYLGSICCCSYATTFPSDSGTPYVSFHYLYHAGAHLAVSNPVEACIWEGNHLAFTPFTVSDYRKWN